MSQSRPFLQFALLGKKIGKVPSVEVAKAADNMAPSRFSAIVGAHVDPNPTEIAGIVRALGAIPEEIPLLFHKMELKPPTDSVFGLIEELLAVMAPGLNDEQRQHISKLLGGPITGQIAAIEHMAATAPDDAMKMDAAALLLKVRRSIGLDRNR
jgi:hypothetical protein